MLSNTCFFKSGLFRFCPGNPPYVLSNSNGLIAFQIPWIALGVSGIILGYAHMNEYDVVTGTRCALLKPDYHDC